MDGHPVRERELPDIAAGSAHDVEFSFDTTLRPDTYPVTVSVSVPGETTRTMTETSSVILVPRSLPQQMPVVMWGIGGVKEVLTELPRLKQIVFTHCLKLTRYPDIDGRCTEAKT